MTEDKTITDNETIARFMGAVLMHEGEWCQRHVFKEGVRTLAYFPEKLQYDTSWDWLMPVWYKFRSLKFDPMIGETKEYIFHFDRISFAIINIFDCSEACKLLAEGIRWYNSTTQNKEQS